MKFFDTVLYCHWHWLTTPYRLRLPTEAEWNFAATGGEKMRFPSGNFLDPTSIHVIATSLWVSMQ
jgi:formylglycine-generating enzyme required for sulfatase activity